MYNTEERVAAVLHRAKEKQWHKQLRQHRIVGISSAALSLLLIVSAAFFIPGVMEQISDYDYANTGTFGSMFTNSNVLGYILIGILAFALGISVTLLGYRMHRKEPLGEEKRADEDEEEDKR